MSIPHHDLTAEQVDELRADLERKLRRLERAVLANGAGRELDQSSVGRLSRIEALQNQDFTRKLRDRERTQLDEVLQALGRIDAGTYGVCADCNAPIAHERLFVFPETRTCGACPNGV